MIKSWIKFNELSGTELIEPLGVASERGREPQTMDVGDTTVIYSELTNIIYTYDQYLDMYSEYLKIGGKPLFGFNKQNLEFLLVELDIL